MLIQYLGLFVCLLLTIAVSTSDHSCSV